MIELYVLVSLMAVGYYVAKQQKQSIPTNASSLLRTNHVVPNRAFANSVYYNQNIPAARALEERRALHMQTKAQQPGSNVIGRFHREQQEQQRTVRNLAGDYIPVEAFLDPSVQPFFGGAVRQMGVEQQRLNSSKLENFTGTNAPFSKPHKTEVEFFGDSDAPTNVFGNPVTDNRDRIVPPMSKRNELPFQKELVGPGHYDVALEVRDSIGPKNVDQLRAANRPKLSGTEGRAMPGGIAGPSVDWTENIPKEHRMPTVSKNADTYLVTTGAHLKPQMSSEPVMRNTVRSQVTEDEQQRMGAAASSVAKNSAGDYQSPDATKKDSVLSSGNGGYVSNVFKALTAPVMDVMAFTLKDIMAVSKTITFAQPQVPAKPKMAPVDKVKTTMKEMLVYDGMGTGYIKGPEMTTVFTDQVARTTIKETLEYSDHGGYIGTNNKCMAVYDPEGIAVALKTTMRETMADASAQEYLRNTVDQGATNPTNRPEDELRITLKDLDVAASQGVLYGPSAIERTNAGYINVDMIAKDTNKQDLVTKSQLPNAFASKDMGYATANPEAKDTNKQFLHAEHFGTSGSAFKADTDRNVMDTARTNCVKEGQLEMRVPTAQGTKDLPNVSTLGTSTSSAPHLPETSSRTSGNLRALSTRDDRVFPGAMTVLPKCTANSQVQGERLDMAAILKPMQPNPFVEDVLKMGDVGV